MSVEYFIYTEKKINGKWQCLNRKNFDGLYSLTYWSGSRSQFTESYEKLRDIGNKISIKDLSEELQKEFKEEDSWEEDSDVIFVSYEKLNEVLPKEKIYDKSGFVLKEDVASYLLDGVPILDYIKDTKRYNELSDEEKKLYQYFEWNDFDGWYYNLQKIKEHIYWQCYELEESTENVRVVLLVSY